MLCSRRVSPHIGRSWCAERGVCIAAWRRRSAAVSTHQRGYRHSAYLVDPPPNADSASRPSSLQRVCVKHPRRRRRRRPRRAGHLRLRQRLSMDMQMWAAHLSIASTSIMCRWRNARSSVRTPLNGVGMLTARWWVGSTQRQASAAVHVVSGTGMVRGGMHTMRTPLTVSRC